MELSGNIVYPREYAILRKMDKTFCDVMNEELELLRQRKKDKEKN